MLVQPHRASGRRCASVLRKKGAVRTRLAVGEAAVNLACGPQNQQEIRAFRYAKTTAHLNLLKILDR